MLYRSLDAARRKINSGARAAGEILDAVNSIVASEPLARVDYTELVDANSFERLDFVRGSCILLIAVRIGPTRLIDNMLVTENNGFSVSL